MVDHGKRWTKKKFGELIGRKYLIKRNDDGIPKFKKLSMKRKYASKNDKESEAERHQMYKLVLVILEHLDLVVF